MQVNKNGIRIDTIKKPKKRQPLDLKLQTVTLIQPTLNTPIELPRITPVIRFMQSQGYKRLRNEASK